MGDDPARARGRAASGVTRAHAAECDCLRCWGDFARRVDRAYRKRVKIPFSWRRTAFRYGARNWRVLWPNLGA